MEKEEKKSALQIAKLQETKIFIFRGFEKNYGITVDFEFFDIFSILVVGFGH